MAIFKSIQSGSGVFQKNLVQLSQTNLYGTSLKFTNVDRTNLSNFLGNLYSSFNLPITIGDLQNFTTGTYLNTGFQYLNQNRVIIAEVPKDSYGELIDGKSIAFSFPTTAGTISLYSTFFKNSILTTAGQMIYSDPNQQSSQFGQPYNLIELPGQSGLLNPITGYSSNIAYLFSDSIQKPQNNNSYSWYSNSPYFVNQTGLPNGVVGTKFPANYSSADGTVDVPVGIAYLDKGFMVITHPSIVNSFDYGAAYYNGNPYSGGTSFSGIYFNTGSSLTFQSFNTEFIQHAVCIALPGEFYQSNNPTFLEAYGPNNTSNNPVAITEIGLYNSNYELLAVAKLNSAVPKTSSSVISFDIQIKV